MNQDLAAWLARINAVPATETPDSLVSANPAGSEIEPAAQAFPQPQQLRVESLPPLAAQPELSSGAAPSPTASPTKSPATANEAPAPSSPADAVAAAGTLSPGDHEPKAPTDPQPGAAATTDAPSVASAEADQVPKVPDPVDEPKPVWTAEAGSTLRTTLFSWTKQAGWPEPRWDAPVDYPVAGEMVFEGDFLDAIRRIFKAYAGVSRPVQVDVYTTQKLIHVTE